jgi:hypothetical protein
MKDCMDEKLAAALHDVTVPEGLDVRLSDCLAAAKNEQRGTKNEEVAVPHFSSFLSRFSRRRVLVVGALLATAVGLLVAVWLGMHTPEELVEQYVLDEAIRSFDAVADQTGQLPVDKPLASHPFSPAVLLIRGTTWQSLESFLGRSGVVYHMPSAAGSRAALFVIAAEPVEGMGSAPALHPFATAGCCASAWREGRLLYVLVVQGDPSTYQAYLNLSHGPMAWQIDKVRLNPSVAAYRNV